MLATNDPRGRKAFILLSWLACLTAFAVEGSARASDALDRITQAGTVTIGYTENAPPFSFLNEQKQPDGYSIELCLKIVESMREALRRPDLAVRYVALSADARINAVARGDVDMECGTTTHTLTRREKVDFSIPIYADGATVMTRQDTPVTGVDDLAGKAIAMLKGTTTERVVRTRLADDKVEATILLVETHGAGLEALRAGRVDAYASDRTILAGLVRGVRDAKLAISNIVLSFEPYAVVLPRGDPDFRLLVDRTLARLYRSRQILPLYAKWFSGPGTPATGMNASSYALSALPE